MLKELCVYCFSQLGILPVGNVCVSLHGGVLYTSLLHVRSFPVRNVDHILYEKPVVTGYWY